MDATLVGLINFDQYHYLMGLAGVASAFVVLIIWSKGL